MRAAGFSREKVFALTLYGFVMPLLDRGERTIRRILCLVFEHTFLYLADPKVVSGD